MYMYFLNISSLFYFSRHNVTKLLLLFFMEHVEFKNTYFPL